MNVFRKCKLLSDFRIGVYANTKLKAGTLVDVERKKNTRGETIYVLHRGERKTQIDRSLIQPLQQQQERLFQ